MKTLATFAILLISVHVSEAKSSSRFSSSRDSLPVTREGRAVLHISPKPRQSGNTTRLTTIALSNCPGTTGKCLKAVRVAVQKSKGMPLVGECLSAKDFGPVLVGVYNAERLPIKDPNSAPNGSIIIYSGSRKSKHGHIEIKTPKGYVSDHVSRRAYAGNVIGIYAL